jgi:opacity protein-like surface antigen
MFILMSLMAISAFASAQVSPPISLHVGGAVSIPSSPEAFSEMYKMGFHGWGGVGYKFMPNFQVVGKVEFHRFNLDTGPYGDLVSGGHNNMLMFGADGRMAFGLPAAPIKPFVLAGAGLARMSMSELSSSDPILAAALNEFQPEATTNVYFNIGAGVELATAPTFSLFAQVRYVSIATEGQSSSFIPISVGLKFF